MLKNKKDKKRQPFEKEENKLKKKKRESYIRIITHLQ